MLTPDQIKLRRRDNEMRQLRLDNQRLENKLADSKVALAILLREMAKHANFSTGVQLRQMADELKD